MKNFRNMTHTEFIETLEKIDISKLTHIEFIDMCRKLRIEASEIGVAYLYGEFNGVTDVRIENNNYVITINNLTNRGMRQPYFDEKIVVRFRDNNRKYNFTCEK